MMLRTGGRCGGSAGCGAVDRHTGDLDEAKVYLDLVQNHLDMRLPLVDIGCGNGRFTRRLAAHAPSVLGVDLAANAIARAVSESANTTKVTYRVLDATAPETLHRAQDPRQWERIVTVEFLLGP